MKSNRCVDSWHLADTSLLAQGWFPLLPQRARCVSTFSSGAGVNQHEPKNKISNKTVNHSTFRPSPYLVTLLNPGEKPFAGCLHWLLSAKGFVKSNWESWVRRGCVAAPEPAWQLLNKLRKWEWFSFYFLFNLQTGDECKWPEIRFGSVATVSVKYVVKQCTE